MKASNCIWDGTHFILAKIGIYAGITSSQQDVITESVNLAQHNPTSRYTCDIETYLCNPSHNSILTNGHWCYNYSSSSSL
jgi:hypothetical protein